MQGGNAGLQEGRIAVKDLYKKFRKDKIIAQAAVV